MTTNGLNTLEYAERLMRAGVPDEQAKAQAMVLYEIINSTLATKRDIEELRSATKRDIEELRSATKRDIEELRSATKQDIEELRSATKQDIADVQKEIKQLDVKIETIKADLKCDIKGLDEKIENVRSDLKKTMTIIMGSYAFLILGTLVTLVKLGMLTPIPPTP